MRLGWTEGVFLDYIRAATGSTPVSKISLDVENQLIIDIALCIIAAWLIAVVGRLLRQPLLLAYLAAGFIIGPHGFRLINNPGSTQTIASLGLILLLFMIGLEMDLKKMAAAGRAIFITGLVQIFGGVGLGFLFFRLTGLGQGWLESLYLAVALAMSSTVIIVKILHDKHELETLGGRITIGILVLQDLAVILFLAVQPSLKDPKIVQLGLAFSKVLLLVGVAYLASRFLLPPLFRIVARQTELVLVGALAWCFALAGFADHLKLSREMGALIAGIMLSTFPYTLDVIPRITSIRDFFVTLFFVALGMTIPVPTWNLLWLMLVFSAFLVATRLLTVFLPLYFMNYGHRISLLPAINLCQISELSLVLLTLGAAANDVRVQSVSVAAFAFVFLAVDSTYAILKNDFILRKTSPWLAKIGFKEFERTPVASAQEDKPPRIFLLGFSWVASSLLEEITRNKPALLPELCIVDFNPEVFERLRKRGVWVVYGDITHPDTLLHAGVDKARILICSLPDSILKGANNLRLLRQLRALNPDAEIIVHSEKIAQVSELYAASASYVTVSRFLEATHLLEVIEAAEKGLLGEERQRQAAQLRGRQEVVP
jgi:Kef-type K+ transport system membrane component KefB